MAAYQINKDDKIRKVDLILSWDHFIILYLYIILTSAKKVFLHHNVQNYRPSDKINTVLHCI